MAGYRIVNTGVKELDYPKGDENVYTRYAGSGGIAARRLLEEAAVRLGARRHQHHPLRLPASPTAACSCDAGYRNGSVDSAALSAARHRPLPGPRRWTSSTGSRTPTPLRTAIPTPSPIGRTSQLHPQFGQGRGRCLRGDGHLLRHGAGGAGADRSTAPPFPERLPPAGRNVRRTAEPICATRRTCSASRRRSTTAIT